jgi:hypothetical protein
VFPVLLLTAQTINKILEEAFRGTQFSLNPFWLATNDYSNAPRKVPSVATQGTEPPIPASFESVFRGKKVEEVVEWLRNKPKEAAIDGNFFAVLDKTATNGKVVIGRVGGYDLEDMENVEFMRFDAEFAALMLYSVQPGRWEELRQSSGLAGIEY